MSSGLLKSPSADGDCGAGGSRGGGPRGNAVAGGRPRRAHAAACAMSAVFHAPTDNCDAAQLAAIPEAPTFYPTAAEFADPMAYIRTLWDVGAAHGICKIVPPADWAGANRALVAEDVTFSTKLQDVHKLRHRHWGVNDEFQSYVMQHHRAAAAEAAAAAATAAEEWTAPAPNGFTVLSNMPFPPLIQDPGARVHNQKHHRRVARTADLYQLYFCVHCRGGFTRVCEDKVGWEGIADALQLPRRFSVMLEDIYVCYFQPLPPAKEVLLSFSVPPYSCTIWGDAVVGRDGPEKMDCSSPSSVARGSPKEEWDPRFESVKEDVPVVSCQACHGFFQRSANGSSGAGDLGRDAMDVDSGRARAGPRRGLTPLTCAGCGRSWHAMCYLGEGEQSSRGRFVCGFEDCSFGFQEKGLYTLARYRAESNDFKARWFSRKLSKGVAPRWQNVESDYWKTVENPTRSVVVKYGNDLDTKRVGSGFPSASNGWMHDRSRGGGLQPHDAPDPWNLNVLPSVCGSLLKYSSHSIKGINVPWLYCGSMFSTFCYHAEDLNMMSINYMHTADEGGGKVWYGAPPGPGALKFESALKTAVPQLFETQPNLQCDLVTMVSPVELIVRGAPVCRAVQRPGEFILTFPQAYHGGFSLGYNVAEAVNFFTPECFPWMRAAVRQTRKRHVEPVFDMTLFVLDLGSRLGVHADLTPNDVAIITNELEFVAERENKQRLLITEALFGRYDEPSGRQLVPGKLCSACSQTCYLSIMFNSLDSKLYCLACVAERLGEFQKLAIAARGDAPRGSSPGPHALGLFVQTAQISDLIRRAHALRASSHGGNGVVRYVRC